jgi:membrane glycosyltransferase
MDPDLRRYLDVTVALLMAVLALLVADLLFAGTGGTLLSAVVVWLFGFFVVSLYLPAPAEEAPA